MRTAVLNYAPLNMNTTNGKMDLDVAGRRSFGEEKGEKKKFPTKERNLQWPSNSALFFPEKGGKKYPRSGLMFDFPVSKDFLQLQ